MRFELSDIYILGCYERSLFSVIVILKIFYLKQQYMYIQVQTVCQ